MPAVPEPLDRRPRVRRRRRAVRERRATAPASTTSTTASGGSPLNPCGDPPGGVGATLTPPTAEGGALRSQDLRTRRRPGRPRRRDPARRPRHRRRRCPTTRSPAAPTPTPGASSPTGCATRSGSRSARARTSSGSATSAGTTWEEIRPHRRPDRRHGRTTSAGPATRGAGSQAGYDAANLNICENLYARPARSPRPTYAYNHSAQVVPGETCPTGSSSISGLAFYAGRRLPGRVRRRAVLRRLLAQLHLGHAEGHQRSARLRPASGRSSPARRTRSTSRSAPDGDLFYADLDGGTIRRISYTAGNQPPVAVAPRDPDLRRRSARR